MAGRLGTILPSTLTSWVSSSQESDRNGPVRVSRCLLVVVSENNCVVLFPSVAFQDHRSESLEFWCRDLCMDLDNEGVSGSFVWIWKVCDLSVSM